MLDRDSLDAVAGAGADLASHTSARVGGRAAANAAEEDLAAVSGIGPRLAAGFVRKRASLDAAEELRRGAEVGARVLTWLDAGDPARLREPHDAPPVFYVRGPGTVLWSERSQSLGLAGHPRRGSIWPGVGEALGEAGVVVVSGLTRGIDRAAHAGALRRGGKTVAVLGCGVDIVYPREHCTLMEAMLLRGGVLSEAPMGVRRERLRFPLRNRLISGMAQAVVVVEGAVDSGSRITARDARDERREIHAVPGRVFAPGSCGPRHLLAVGARVLRDPAELPERLKIVHPSQAAGTLEERLSEDEARVTAVLGETGVHIDGMINSIGLGAGRVAGALATLEVRGIVRQCPGKRFARRSGFRESAQEPAGGDTWPNLSSS